MAPVFVRQPLFLFGTSANTCDFVVLKQNNRQLLLFVVVSVRKQKTVGWWRYAPTTWLYDLVTDFSESTGRCKNK